MSRTVALVMLATCGGAGCVAASAGVRESIMMVQDRTGHTVRAVDDDDDDDGGVSPEARRLLARRLDPDAVAQVALLENRALLAELDSVGVARSALVGAGLLPNPRVEGEVLFDGDHDVTWAGSATIELGALLHLPSRRGAAAVALEAAGLRAAGRAIDLAFSARVAALRHVGDLRRVALRRTDLEAAAAGLETARALAASGGGTPLDVSVREVAYHEARLALADAETAAATSRERVGVLMGVWGAGASWSVDDRLPAPPADEPSVADLERRAVARSLELAAAGKDVEATARRVGAARFQGVLPELEVGAAAEHEDEGLRLGPTASLTLPLFAQGQGETGALGADLRRRQHERVALAVRTRAAARTAATRLHAARERAIFFREVLLPARARIVEQMTLEVNAMSAGVYQLLQARREHVDAEARAVDALAEYWIARARVAQLLAGGMAPEDGDARAPEAASLETSEGGH